PTVCCGWTSTASSRGGWSRYSTTSRSSTRESLEVSGVWLPGFGRFVRLESAQVAERVDARGVAAGIADLQRVLADQRHVRHVLLVVGQLGQRIQAAGRAALAPALGAGTGPAEQAAAEMAAHAILPRDLQHVGGSVQVDRGRERIRIFQRMLITGSCRKDWIEVFAATWV